jgi:hypothetical protein
MLTCRRFAAAQQSAANREYARICLDMQRFGNFRDEVPEIDESGFIDAKPKKSGSDSGVFRRQGHPDVT